MSDEILFDEDAMFESLVIKKLEKLNSELSVSKYPYLNNSSMHLYDKNEIFGLPMLFELHGYYFIGYYQGADSCLEVAVGREKVKAGFKYFDRFMEIPLFASALSLSERESCVSVTKISEFLSYLPIGSFIEVTSIDGTQVIGFFLGLVSGRIELAVGYDLDAGKFEKSTELSLYKRENLNKDIAFPDKSLSLMLCKKIVLLETREGKSDTSFISNEESTSNNFDETIEKIRGLFYIKKPSEMIILFDSTRGKVFHVNRGKQIRVATFPGVIAGSILGRYKIYASLDQAEKEEDQKGEYIESYSGEEYKIQIVITYPSPGCYTIRLSTDWD